MVLFCYFCIEKDFKLLQKVLFSLEIWEVLLYFYVVCNASQYTHVVLEQQWLQTTGITHLSEMSAKASIKFPKDWICFVMSSSWIRGEQ